MSVHHLLSANHGCLLTSSIVNLFLISTSRHPFIKLSASCVSRTLGLEILPALAASASAKGHSPTRRIERRTPSAQTSEMGGWYASPRRISLLAQEEVPTKPKEGRRQRQRGQEGLGVLNLTGVKRCGLARVEDDGRAKVDELDLESEGCVSAELCLQAASSTPLTLKSAEMTMFSSLISRWQMPSDPSAATTSTIWRKTYLAVSASKRLCCSMHSNRSQEARRSMGAGRGGESKGSSVRGRVGEAVGVIG